MCAKHVFHLSRSQIEDQHKICDHVCVYVCRRCGHLLNAHPSIHACEVWGKMGGWGHNMTRNSEQMQMFLHIQNEKAVFLIFDMEVTEVYYLSIFM